MSTTDPTTDINPEHEVEVQELDRVTVRFAGATFRPGDHVYVDEDGIVVAQAPLG